MQTEQKHTCIELIIYMDRSLFMMYVCINLYVSIDTINAERQSMTLGVKNCEFHILKIKFVKKKDLY